MFCIPINQPTLPNLREFLPHLKQILKNKILTNGFFVNRLEEELKEYLKVKGVVCVSSATSGLLLLIKALNLKGKILVPSFTFSATVHAIVWNNLEPVFVDCDKMTFNLDLEDLERKITPDTSAILGVHVFGNPLDMESLGKIAKKHNLKLIIDGAHALGAKIKDKSVAHFADATVFSLAPTKLVTSCEGGVIATKDLNLAKKIKVLRNYGNTPNYDCRYIGLNARLSEIHAVFALSSLKFLDEYVQERNNLAEFYKQKLQNFKGIYFQLINEGCLSTYNYFAIVIDKRKFGLDALYLKEELKKEGIETKRYFYPPVHLQSAYKKYYSKNGLINTEELSKNILCLPLYSHMGKKTVSKICDKISSIVKRKG